MTVTIYSSASYGHRLALGYDISSTDTAVTITYFGSSFSTGRSNGIEVVTPQTYVRQNSANYVEGWVKLGSTTLVNVAKTDSWSAFNTVRTYTINKTHAAQSLTLSYYRKEYGQQIYPIGTSNVTTVDWAFTASGTISVPAKTSYTVSYNANNGSGAPSAQTKWYGEALTLSTTKPTRQYYKFDGWATSASGAAVYCTGTNNTSNTSYTSNAAVTLYAHWTRVHQPPTISSFTVIRCDANGDPDDEGTYCKANVTWSVDTVVYSSNVGSTLSIAVSGINGTKSVNLSGTGTTTETIYDVAVLSTDSTYTVTATVTDGQSTSTSRNAILSTAFFTMDFAQGGHGVGIGKPAPTAANANLLDIGMATNIDGDVTMGGKATVNSNTYFNASSFYKSSNINRDGTAPSSNAWGSYVIYRDKDNENIGCIAVVQRTSGVIGTALYAYNENSGSQVSNYLEVDVATDGTPTYLVYSPAAFRDSIGSLGATTANGYEGMLTRSGASNQWIRTTQNGLIPYASGGGSSSLGTSSWPFTNMYAQNVYSSGAKVYAPTRIFSSTALCTTFTLTSSVANYYWLTVQFRGNDGFHNSVTVWNNKGSANVALAVIESTANGTVNIKRATYTLSGTSGTIKTYGEMDGNAAPTSTKNVTVVGVWGWA